MAANFDNILVTLNTLLSKVFGEESAEKCELKNNEEINWTGNTQQYLDKIECFIRLLVQHKDKVKGSLQEIDIESVDCESDMENVAMETSISPTKSSQCNPAEKYLFDVGTQTEDNIISKPDTKEERLQDQNSTGADENLVQIKAPKSEIDRRISAFIEQKRQEVDDLNKREFCSIVNPDSEESDSCARVDSMFVTHNDGKSHIKVSRVVNLYGPQTITGSQTTSDTSKQEKTTISQGVEERLKNMENHLKIRKGEALDAGDVYGRLRCLEERILYLEGLSPEYFDLLPSRTKRPYIKKVTNQEHQQEQMDDPTIGSNARATFQTVVPPWSKAVPIHKEEVRFSVGRYKVAQVSRRQFLLTLSWACTIHKVQGQTLDKIVISCNGRYQPGQFYVAVSRVTKLSGLFFLKFNENCISCNKDVTKEIQRMSSVQPLQLLPLWTPDHATITITHLNINSLVAHIKDLKADFILSRSDVICITETWLSSRHSDSSMKMDSFNILRVDRESCYNHDEIHSSKLRYGGVCSYTSFQWRLQALHDHSQNKCIEYELFKAERNLQSVLVLHVYRPPWITLKDFTTKLLQIIEKLDRLPTVIVGDFNVNILKEPKNILLKGLAAKDFSQVVRSPTHISGSCIDHIYIIKPTEAEVRVIPVSYSQHAAIQVKIKI